MRPLILPEMLIFEQNSEDEKFTQPPIHKIGLILPRWWAVMAMLRQDGR